MTITIDNETSRTLPGALLALLYRAIRPGYAVDAWMQEPDLISTRGERTSSGAIEVEIFADGSGLEVAYRGKL